MFGGRWQTRALVLAITGVAVLATAGAASAKRTIHVNPFVRTGHAAPFSPAGRSYNDTVESSNWSGYAVQSTGTFTYVTGSWVQPAVSCSSRTDQYAAFWAGIDGYSSDSVEQLGTDSDCDGVNRPSYYAWYEMYPAGSVDISTSKYPVKAGDTLTASVAVSGSTYTLTLGSSEGWNYSVTKTQSGLADSSAELIAESPELCSRFSCTLAQLSDFGTVNYSNVEATSTAIAESPFGAFTTDNGPHDIIAVTSNGTQRATPSALNGTSFSITWHHD